MQHALILIRILPERAPDGALQAIMGITHDGRSVRFDAQADQQVNLVALEHQQVPMLLLADRLYQPFSDLLSVPGDALLSIVPLSADHIRQLLERGEGDRLLEAVSVQLP